MEYFNEILHAYTCQHFLTTCMHNSKFNGRGFAEHQILICDQVLKMLITPLVYLVQTLYTYVFKHCPATGMQTGDEASPSIILAGEALLVKMLITLEPCGAFGSNFEYLCILTSHWYTKR